MEKQISLDQIDPVKIERFLQDLKIKVRDCTDYQLCNQVKKKISDVEQKLEKIQTMNPTLFRRNN